MKLKRQTRWRQMASTMPVLFSATWITESMVPKMVFSRPSVKTCLTYCFATTNCTSSWELDPFSKALKKVRLTLHPLISGSAIKTRDIAIFVSPPGLTESCSRAMTAVASYSSSPTIRTTCWLCLTIGLCLVSSSFYSISTETWESNWSRV